MSATGNKSNPNLGFAGFLMKKTSQPFSLRQKTTNFSSNYKNSNMIVYINKKFAEIRQRIGTNRIPFDLLANPCIRVKPQKKNFEEMRKDVYDELNREINEEKSKKITFRTLEKMKKKEKGSDENPIKIPKLIEHFSADKKIRQLLYNLFEEDKLISLYRQYKIKKKSLSQHSLPIFHAEILKSIDNFEDKKIINEIREKNKIDLAKILGIDNELIKESIIETNDEIFLDSHRKAEEANKTLKQKHSRLSVEDISKILDKQERKNVSQSLESFNNTRMDNMALQKSKTKRKGIDQAFFFKMKEKNEQLDQKIFQEHLSEIHNTIRKNTNRSHEKFVRSKENTIYQNRNTSKTTRQKSQSFWESRASSANKAQNKIKMQEFIQNCNEDALTQKLETKRISNKINEIGNLLEKVSEKAQNDKISLSDPNYIEYLDQREFKKKIINSFLERILDPQNILSHYQKKNAQNKNYS